jgi:LAO/AO transport system kinase
VKLIDRIAAREVRALAQSVTAVENRSEAGKALMRSLFFKTGGALTIGITGPPGAGKSTLVSALTRVFRAEGSLVGVLAVDPTSPFTGGAILGDRVRMQEWHADKSVFIRSMATRGRLGGIAAATSDVALLLDAAGFENILIETVGVGQDEVDVASLADVTAVVLVPGMGDDIQAIKAGIMEVADVYVLNKADQPGIDKLEAEVSMMCGLVPRDDGWVPPIVRCVASDHHGVDDVVAAIRSVVARGKLRSRQSWTIRLREMYRERLLDQVPVSILEQAAEDVAARRKDPYTIVDEWLS